jgi:outer membrane protein
MKTKHILTLVTLLTMFSVGVHPVAAKDVKIGFVDFQKVFETSKVIHAMNSQLQSKIQAEQKEIEKKKESLEEMQKDLEAKKELMNAQARTQKEEEIRQNLKDLKRYASDKEEEFQRKGNGLMQQIMKQLTMIVQDMGEKEGYTAIVERSTGGVVYFTPSSDLTEAVIKEYDKRNK